MEGVEGENHKCAQVRPHGSGRGGEWSWAVVGQRDGRKEPPEKQSEKQQAWVA